MRACERCGGLTIFRHLVNGTYLCKACTHQARREAARRRHPAGKRSTINRRTA